MAHRHAQVFVEQCRELDIAIVATTPSAANSARAALIRRQAASPAPSQGSAAPGGNGSTPVSPSSSSTNLYAMGGGGGSPMGERSRPGNNSSGFLASLSKDLSRWVGGWVGGEEVCGVGKRGFASSLRMQHCSMAQAVSSTWSVEQAAGDHMEACCNAGLASMHAHVPAHCPCAPCLSMCARRRGLNTILSPKGYAGPSMLGMEAGEGFQDLRAASAPMLAIPAGLPGAAVRQPVSPRRGGSGGGIIGAAADTSAAVSAAITAAAAAAVGAPAAAAQPAQPLPLPQGWEVKYDAAHKREFYVDHNTKTTTWVRPTAPAPAAAAAVTASTTPGGSGAAAAAAAVATAMATPAPAAGASSSRPPSPAAGARGAGSEALKPAARRLAGNEGEASGSDSDAAERLDRYEPLTPWGMLKNAKVGCVVVWRWLSGLSAGWRGCRAHTPTGWLQTCFAHSPAGAPP